MLTASPFRKLGIILAQLGAPGINLALLTAVLIILVKLAALDEKKQLCVFSRGNRDFLLVLLRYRGEPNKNMVLYID